MKKRAIILFFSIYMIVAMFTVISSVQMSSDSINADEGDNDRMDIVATSPFEICNYDDYFYYGNPDTWVYPEAYVGASAVFNVDLVDNYIIATKDEIENAEYVNPMSEENFYDQFDFIENTVVCNEDGESIKVVVADYVLNVTDAETMTGDLWFKIEAADGYTLPQALQDRPYVLCQTFYEDYQSLLFFPEQGMFIGETVTVSKSPVLATKTQIVSVADLPLSFDISYILSDGDYWYDLGDVSEWQAITDAQYHYIKASDASPIPLSVAHAYGLLMSSETSDEFNARLDEIPDKVLASLTETHKEKLLGYREELVALENVEYSNKVAVNGVELDVAAKGKIPADNMELEAVPVDDISGLAASLGIEKASDIIVALDIKIINKGDGTEWQPESGHPVALSIDMASLGYEDGSVVRLHHIHGDEIDTYEIFIVEDGKITFVTGSFSIYAVQKVGDTNTSGNATLVSPGTNNNRDITISIGDDRIFYIWPNGDRNNSHREPVKGTWVVTDTTGSIHYTVHSNVDSTDIGHDRVNARWINIVALKETPVNQPIKLTFKYVTGTGNNATVYEETYNLYVTRPKATSENGGRRLYIKDMVNSTGCITAALVDTNGNEINDKLAGAAFEWTRDDGLFIVPQAYSGDLNDPNAANDFRSVSIVQDHGGLVEARKKYQIDGKENSGVIGYKPVTYTLRATLSDGTVLTDSYTVYYQSEIINAGFEFPTAQKGTYNFFPNGYSELYWKTTAPGSNAAKLTQDIEYGNVTNLNNDGASYGITAYRPEGDTTSAQFAEINAEEFGALYQDIITVPETSIDWDFMHAARQQQNNGVNSMFVVFGPTEQAQTLTTQDHLNQLGIDVKNAVKDRDNYTAQQEADFYDGKLGVTITFSYKDSGISATYTVWYHTVDRSKNNGWVQLKGEYEVPEGQYRTRVFFVTDTAGVSGNENYGNMIDKAYAGQYKTYLVEYFEESYVTTTNPDGTTTSKLVVTHWKDRDEKGKALIYYSQPLTNFTKFETEQHDYLHSILINNKNYPYDIKYSGTPSLYIKQYPGQASDTQTPPNLVDKDGNSIEDTGNNYQGYDIVVQVFFRDTVIAVKKELILPTQTAETEGMTDEQKITLFEELKKSADGGYKTTFTLTSSDIGDSYNESESTVISQRDPAGKYTAYVALGESPELGKNYVVSELIPENPTGLVLSKVTFVVTRYYMGAAIEDLIEQVSYEKTEYPNLDNLESVSTNKIYLGDITHDGKTKSVKIADVTVINEYVEKETTIYYEAVGNGKVAIVPESGLPNFQDTPKETLAFYSGKAVGADVFAGHGAKFVGWFTDPECTQEVKLRDGVVDANGNFKPNSNIIDVEEVTFYAKFETNSVTIERTNGIPGQTYVYKVEASEGTNTTVMYVTVTCGANGIGSTQILEAVSSQYKVTEIGCWSWRSEGGQDTQSFTPGTSGSDAKLHITFSFNGKVKEQEWSNGYSASEKNVYDVSGGGSQ